MARDSTLKRTGQGKSQILLGLFVPAGLLIGLVAASAHHYPRIRFRNPSPGMAQALPFPARR